MHQVKSKHTKQIVYFRFFSERNPDEFWYTPTIESIGFNIGKIDDFIPVKNNWNGIKNEKS